MAAAGGDRVADVLFPPVKIDYGGIQAFIILGSLIVVGRTYLRITGQGNAIWAMIRKKAMEPAVSGWRENE